MTEFEIGLYVSILLFVFGSLISIFSPDIRARISGISFRVSFPSRNRRNQRILKRIELLEELTSSPSAMLAYFASQAFVVIIFLAVVLFFGFMMVLRIHAALSALSFLGAWLWFLVIVGTPLEVAGQLRNPVWALENLREKVQP